VLPDYTGATLDGPVISLLMNLETGLEVKVTSRVIEDEKTGKRDKKKYFLK
jgi:hypothetical protein